MKKLNLSRPLNLLFVSVLMIFSMFTTSCENKSSDNKAVRPVYYQIVGSERGKNQFSLPGVVANQKATNLSFKVSGEITKFNVVVGQRVNKGSVLASLNDANYILNLTQVRALDEAAISNVDKSRKQLEKVKSSYSRIEQLYANNHASLNEYENAKNNYENAEEGLKAAKSQAMGTAAKVESAKNQLDYTRLIAPFNGTVSKIFSAEGEMIGSGKPLIVLESHDEFEVEASVPESRINQLEAGQKVEVRIASLSRKINGVVSEISPGTKARAGYPVKILFNEKVEGLKSGMSVKVNVISSEIETSSMPIVIDPDAVSKKEDQFMVYVLTKNEDETYTAEERFIVTGGLTDNGYIVSSGLKEGERIATAGISFLYNGRIVRLKEQTDTL